jgi:hypothetical protein
MERPHQSRGPLIIAIVLLALPMLYVGGYLALVLPQGVVVSIDHFDEDGRINSQPIWSHYRLWRGVAPRIFWPLEQFDRKLRPDAWSTWSDGPLE